MEKHKGVNVKLVPISHKHPGRVMAKMNMLEGFLAEQGYDPLYGARPLKRAVQNYVEDILADAIIDKSMVIGTKAYSISHKKGEDKLSLK